MSEEENLRNKLDRLNQNSHYGLGTIEDKVYLDLARIWNLGPGEVEKIVRDYIGVVTCDFKKLQPYPKQPIYIKPVKLKTLRDRIIEEAAKELQNEVDKLILKEEIKMNATSTENFKDIIAIDFELHTFPNPDEQDKFIVSATNRDDIFEFVFEGPHLADACRKAGLLNGWEKDQKIRGLEEKIKQLERDNAFDKETADTWSKEYYDLSKKFAKLQEEKDQKIMEKNKEIDKLKQQLQQVEDDKERLTERYKNLEKQYNLEKAANEAHHKFFRQYAGKGTEIEFNRVIGDGEEVTYAIVDKERYQSLKNKVNDLEEKDLARQKAYDILDKALQDSQRNCDKWYEKWLNAQVEQDSHNNTRADILDQAKKCVCGQREQDYGTPESNFQLIADLWNDYLGITDYVLELEERFMDLNNKGIKVDVNFPKPKTIFPEDVAMMMALLKIARIRNGGGSGDSFVDLAGYAACGGEIWYGGKTQISKG